MTPLVEHNREQCNAGVLQHHDALLTQNQLLSLA